MLPCDAAWPSVNPTASNMETRNAPVHLIYAADGGFAMPLAVSLYSVLRHLSAQRSACVYIVDGGFTAVQRRRIEAVAERGARERTLHIHWVQPCRSWWGGVQPDFSGKHLNETVLYRLGVPHFLPGDVETAIYIDADVVAKADVGELEQQIVPGCGVSAVTDYCMATWSLRYWHRPEPLAALGLSGDEPYFNAGVLGINVRYWRENGVASAAAQFLANYCNIAGFYDQDALNYVLRGRWHALHPGWNFPPTCRDTVGRRGATVEQRTGLPYAELQQQAKLVHFTGAKPWNQGFTNPERPTFVRELRESRWFGVTGYRAWAAGWYCKLLFRGLWKKWYWAVRPRVLQLARKGAA